MAGNTEKISERIFEYREYDYKRGVEYLTRIIEKGDCLHPVNDSDRPFKEESDRWYYPDYEKRRNNEIMDMLDLQSYLERIFPGNYFEIIKKTPIYRENYYSVYVCRKNGKSMLTTKSKCDFKSIERNEWNHIVNVIKGVEE